MNSRYHPSEIPFVSAPITSANLRNSNNQPVVDCGYCTPFQLFSKAAISDTGTVCIIGNPARGIGIAKAMVRRSQKPFLLLSTVSDGNSPFSSLTPEWSLNTAQENLPAGNGAIFFSRPYSSYLEMSEYLETWSQDHFLILHLGNGLQIGAEILNLLHAIQQCLIICDSIPQSIRNDETRTITPLEFLKQMSYLMVFSSGSVTKDVIDLLPTYQYEKITNTTGVNTYRNRPLFHPLRIHRGHGVSVGQTRTMEFEKHVFEMDELQRIFEDGYMLTYNSRSNRVFLAMTA